MKKTRYIKEAKQRLKDITEYKKKVSAYSSIELSHELEIISAASNGSRIKHAILRHYINIRKSADWSKPAQRNIKNMRFAIYKGYDVAICYIDYFMRDPVLKAIITEIATDDGYSPLPLEYFYYLRDLSIAGNYKEYENINYFFFDYYYGVNGIIWETGFWRIKPPEAEPRGISGEDEESVLPRQSLGVLTRHGIEQIKSIRKAVKFQLILGMALQQAMLSASDLTYTHESAYEDKFLTFLMLLLWLLVLLPIDRNLNCDFYKYVTTLSKLFPEIFVRVNEKWHISDTKDDGILSGYIKDIREQCTTIFSAYKDLAREQTININMLEKMQAGANDSDYILAFEFFFDKTININHRLVEFETIPVLLYRIPELLILFSPRDIARYCKIKPYHKQLGQDKIRYFALQNLVIYLAKNDLIIPEVNIQYFYILKTMYQESLNKTALKVELYLSKKNIIFGEDVMKMVENVFFNLFHKYKFDFVKKGGFLNFDPYSGLLGGREPDIHFEKYINAKLRKGIGKNKRKLYGICLRHIIELLNESINSRINRDSPYDDSINYEQEEYSPDEKTGNKEEDNSLDTETSLIDETPNPESTNEPDSTSDESIIYPKASHSNINRAISDIAFPRINWRECDLVSLNGLYKFMKSKGYIGFHRKYMPTYIKELKYITMTGNKIKENDKSMEDILSTSNNQIFAIIPRDEVQSLIQNLIHIKSYLAKYKGTNYLRPLKEMLNTKEYPANRERIKLVLKKFFERMGRKYEGERHDQPILVEIHHQIPYRAVVSKDF